LVCFYVVKISINTFTLQVIIWICTKNDTSIFENRKLESKPFYAVLANNSTFEDMKKADFRSTCAIARTLDLVGDTWSLLILRDMLFHQKSTFKEFSESKEKIATNILSHRLIYLTACGFINKIQLKGTKKSTQYVATEQGLNMLPILVELYQFSINSITEEVLNDSQLAYKTTILKNPDAFIKSKRKAYSTFMQQFESTPANTPSEKI
jgi:DNA-binding HxlR family transcriptional regulator